MKNKIAISILILTILAGTIILFVLGFEKSILYKAGTRIEIYIPQGYEKQDIINIAQESFNGKKIQFEEIEDLNQIAGLRINEKYTEEEIKNLKSKISEKYNIDEKELDIFEISMPTKRISNDIRPYVKPVSLVTIITLIYILLRNIKKQSKWKMMLKMTAILAIVLGLYFSLMLIIRIPYGVYTMPIALAIYISTLIITVNRIKE